MKKISVAIAFVLLLLMPFILTGCEEVRVDSKFETTNLKWESGSYPDSIFTRNYGSVSFTLTNITDETLSVKVRIIIIIKNDNIYKDFKKQETKSLDFLPDESRNFSFSTNSLSEKPCNYRIEIIQI